MLTGCQSTGPSGSAESGVSALQFNDIPVPDGFNLVERYHQSDSRQVGDYRYGNFVYRGSMTVADASAYLRERMPQHRWTLESQESTPDGGETLQFARGRYQTECALSRDSGSATVMTVKVRTVASKE